MRHFTEQDGVIFTEESVLATPIGPLQVRARTQNTTLVELKAEMARQARLMGGNGIVRFAYTQVADSPLKNILSLRWDTERLVGTGDVVRFEHDPRNASRDS